MTGQGKVLIVSQTGDLLRASVSQWWVSVEIAAAQKKPAGLANHLAAGIFHLRSAIRAITGDISRSETRLAIFKLRRMLCLVLLAHILAV